MASPLHLDGILTKQIMFIWPPVQGEKKKKKHDSAVSKSGSIHKPEHFVEDRNRKQPQQLHHLMGKKMSESALTLCDK